MFKKLLLAYDGSDGAKLALEKALELAKAAETEIYVLAVGRIPEYAETVSESKEARDQATKFYSPIIEEAVDSLKAEGLTAEGYIKFGKPADVILRMAAEPGVELIVLGTNPHSPL